MIDTKNPNDQFHSYQSPDFTPVSETPVHSGWSGMLSKLGVNTSSLDSVKSSLNNVRVGESVNKARQYAAVNPGKVLGGLAALVIGAGMLRGRTIR